MLQTSAVAHIEALRQNVGKVVGVSSFFKISQQVIDDFARATQDFQFIHVDAEKAKAGPFGHTIAHGLLTLSMISAMFYDAVPSSGPEQLTINYGFDKVRFLQPIPSGATIRGIFTLADVTERTPQQFLFRYSVTIETEGGNGPSVYAEWLVLKPGNSASL